MKLSDQQLVAEAFEGTLDEAGFRKLQDRLRAEPGLLALYREQAMLHHSLAEEFDGRRMIGGEPRDLAARSRRLPLLVAVLCLTGLIFAAWKWLGAPHGNEEVFAGNPESPVAPAAPSSGIIEERVLLRDRFDSGPPLAGRQPGTGESHWRLERGAPELTGDHLDGSNYEAYFTLPADGLSAEFPVLLVTVTTAAPAGPPFHSPGWAGVSLYQDGYEICFFGDSYGNGGTWSLDVKRRLPPIISTPPVQGAQTMSLSYDRRDGTVGLYQGSTAEGAPLAASKLLPGLKFDQVRIGASEGASFPVALLELRSASGLPE
ncbi:hypothetical protein [Luteolibacter marinus]|uniref:hypothetical protein n=1 Tax=Luteolibacter marinus TaxID=2776705 RepID=UPI0018681376|nr:hypothetical protein [Luteolibacter marinus]